MIKMVGKMYKTTAQFCSVNLGETHGVVRGSRLKGVLCEMLTDSCKDWALSTGDVLICVQ